MVELTQQVESQKREIQQLKRELAAHQHADGAAETDGVQIDHVPGPPPAEPSVEPGQLLGGVGGKVRTSPEEEGAAGTLRPATSCGGA